MNRKNKVLLCSAAMLLMATMLFSGMGVMPVQAVTPPYPASDYFQDITAAGPPWLSYDYGGVRILLTPLGDSVGMWWDGAWALSYFTIDSWESQTGTPWPYQWRSRESVAREIQLHCWIFDTTQRVTTISFSGY